MSYDSQVTNVPTAIAPMLSVRNGVKAIEFYKSAFGAAELFRVDDGSGAVVARLSVGGAVNMERSQRPRLQDQR